ncbi:mTERF [Carex littledalei]|uniref:mTERF n=1 Tax=Carex littledalei TaxID=544730 RepID=A0A833QZ15_9POAL|nr:mTERF [Carex littledalei]
MPQLLRSKLFCTHHSAVPLQCTFLSPMVRLFSALASPLSKREVLKQYLVKSCEFSPSEATRAAKQIPCHTTVSKPKSVVAFLKQNGLDVAHIRTAVLRDPRLLVLDVEKTLKPTVNSLERLGFSLSDITRLLCVYPLAFRCSSLEQNIKFWMPIVGSVEKLFGLLKKDRFVLTTDPDKVVAPNLDFLQKKCGLSGSQIVKMSQSRLLTGNTENVKEIIKRAMKFGIPSCSPLFKDILLASAQEPQKIKSKIKTLMTLGWSESEVLSMIRKKPSLLRNSGKILKIKANFLIKDVGMDLAFVARNPILLMLSMNKRLVPRHHVLIKLKAAHLPDGKRSFYCISTLSEQKFLDKFVFPNLGSIPDLYSTYTANAVVKVPAKRGLNDQAEVLRALEFSESQVLDIITKESKLGTKCEEQMRATVDFLITHVGFDRSYIANHPKILTYSLKRRLIPRYYVTQCLELKGLGRKYSILNVMNLNDTDFMEQFISSYEGIIPGLAENYDSARAGRPLKSLAEDVLQEAQ